MVYFTSDLHFGHENIIDHCCRPFGDLEEMNRVLVERWNAKVKRCDTVYILGDAVWKKKDVGRYMEQLKGKKILITGNHDASWAKSESVRGYFEQILPFAEVYVEERPLTLCHYPLLDWRDSECMPPHKVRYLVHGHIHNRVAPEYAPLFRKVNALNAGVDVNGFEPVSFEELFENNLRFKLAALDSREDRELLSRMAEEVRCAEREKRAKSKNARAERGAQ